MKLKGKALSKKIKVAEITSQKEMFELNSGRIFFLLQDHWEEFPRKIVLRLENLFRSNATAHDIISERYNAEEEAYFKNYLEFRFPSAQRTAQDPKFFPFPSYFLKTIDEDPYPSIIRYETSCMIKRDDLNFDQFFALQIALTKSEDLEQLLRYHLKNSFKNKLAQYRKYLEIVNIELQPILKVRTARIDKYISESLSKVQAVVPLVIPPNAVIQKEKAKEITVSRQVLAMYFLLGEIIPYSSINKTAICEFIFFIAGKETGARKITNTNIYKRLKSPLPLNDKSLESDLKFIRSYFENMELDAIVQKINKEITS